MRTRKLGLGKVLAFVLTFALVLPFAGSAQVQAASPTPEDLLTFTVDGGNSTGLEIGDEFTVKIGMKSAVSGVHTIEGSLQLSSEYFAITEFTPEDSSAWETAFTCYSSMDEQQIMISALNATNGVDVTAGTVLATAKIVVKKAVADTTDIGLTSATVAADDTTYSSWVNTPIKNQDISITLTNSKASSRKVELSMASKLNVPVGGETDSQTVDIPVVITSNTGFTGLHLQFSYQQTMLTYKNIKLSSAARLSGVQSDVNVNNGSISVVLTAPEDVKITGTLFTLYFAAAAGNNVQVGATTTITPSVSTNANHVINQSEVSMSASISADGQNSCTVTFIKGYELGDVNMDGTIDLIDATWVLQSYNGVRVLSEQAQKLADVNKSGGPTLVDALLIMKFYNGTIRSFN
jgi:hypothetical protein